MFYSRTTTTRHLHNDKNISVSTFSHSHTSTTSTVCVRKNRHVKHATQLQKQIQVGSNIKSTLHIQDNVLDGLASLFYTTEPEPSLASMHVRGCEKRKKKKWIPVDLSHHHFSMPYLLGNDSNSDDESTTHYKEEVVSDHAIEYEESWLSSFGGKYSYNVKGSVNQNILRHKKKWHHMKVERSIKDKYAMEFRGGAARFYRPSSTVTCIKSRVYRQIVERLLLKADLFGSEKILKPHRVPHLRHYTHLLHEQIYLIHIQSSSINQTMNTRLRASSTIIRDTSNHHTHHTRQQQYAILPAHALLNDNAPEDLHPHLLVALMELQQREVTPEDYDLLLQLDALRVAPKTVAVDVVNSLKMERMNDRLFNESPACCICQEFYTMTDTIKHMPHCEHFFHVNCIDTWLRNSSQNCPLDGVPVVR